MDHGISPAPASPRPLRRSSTTWSPAPIAVAVTGAVIVLIEVAMFVDAGLGPVATLCLFPLLGLVYLGAGVVAWSRRPHNTLGTLMVAGGLMWEIVGLVNTTVRSLAVVGVVLATVPIALVVWLLLAFPSGRLRGPAARGIVVLGFVVSGVLQAPLYLFDPGGSPDGVLLVADRPDLLQAGLWLQRGAGIITMVLAAAVLVGRIRRAGEAQRRVLLPLYLYGTVAVVLMPLLPSVVGPTLRIDPVTIVVAQIVVMALVPVAFLLAMLRGGFARTGELDELGAWLGASESVRTSLVDALRRTLGDDSLRLAYWSSQRGLLVDGTGDPVVMGGRGRVTVPVELGGRQVGAIEVDGEVVEDVELVRAAGQVAAIAIDHDRLTADLRAHRAELEVSRGRLVEAADRERRRIAQNLHDGLQVDLVVLALEAQQLSEQPGLAPRAAADARGLRAGIDDAATRLRELVHAVMPAGLVERGLGAAVEDLVDRMPVPTRLRLVGADGRFPETVESTAYFVVAEALTNAVKHADARTLAVSIEHVADRLVVDVRDDGVGGASSGVGLGLRGLADRVDVLGGRLIVDSPDGCGTRLVAELPCGS